MNINKLQRVGKFSITEKGQVGFVNLSSIWDKLIRLAAKHTKHYASDLMYDYESVMKYTSANDFEEKDKSFYFGFRDCGVDHQDFIEHRSLEEYNSIWKMTVNVVSHNKYDTMTVELYEVKGDK